MFCQADCERRERQRQTENDGARRSPAPREGVSRAVEPEAGQNMLVLGRDRMAGHI
jgi:hypothetical protein